LGNYILRALQETGFETRNIGNLKANVSFRLRLKEAYLTKLSPKIFLRDREPMVLADYAAQVAKRLECNPCDIVFSPGTIPIAYLETGKPVVFWTDATFAGLLDFYFSSTRLCADSIKNGHKMEQRALSKCRMAIYSSEWAARTAIQNYDVNPEKVKVVPFGANISCDRSPADIVELVGRRSRDICKLLFLGVDWQRKGGELAVEVARMLIQRGIRAELHVVGCQPRGEVPDFVKVYGFLSKADAEGKERLERVLSESNFLIVPSRAECYGLVFAEASSYGLPSLATDVGGIPTLIRNGKNGHIFPLDEGPAAYCDYIEVLFSSPDEYRELALSSFQEYSERLNWTSAGRKVRDLIAEIV
jgi:glycosyltransferase involved in cell wall biosynthesis